MKEIVVDFRRVHTQHAPLTINGVTVERVSSTRFLGVHITEDLSWTNNTAARADPPYTQDTHAALDLKDVLILVSFLILASGSENMNDRFF